MPDCETEWLLTHANGVLVLICICCKIYHYEVI